MKVTHQLIFVPERRICESLPPMHAIITHAIPTNTFTAFQSFVGLWETSDSVSPRQLELNIRSTKALNLTSQLFGLQLPRLQPAR